MVGSRADLAEGSHGVDFPISAVTGEGIDTLVSQLATLVAQACRDELAAVDHEIVIHRPIPEEVIVERVNENTWTIEGRPALRAVRFQDLTDDQALDEVVRRLKALGVDKMLSRAGVRDGDVVTCGQLTFEWWRDQGGSGLDRDHHRTTRRERLARSGRLDLGDGDDDDD